MKQPEFFHTARRMNEFITVVVYAFCLRQYYQVGNDSVLVLLQIPLLCLGKVLLQVCLILSSQQRGANICWM